MVIERLGGKVEMRSAVAEARREKRRIGFVPTMGALHEGHLSLVRAACGRTDFVVVSIFVNPTQFGEGEDFAAYPRDLEADLGVLAAEGVDIVFTPTTEVMYGAGPQVTVEPGPLANRWEGAARPGHFSGVATIVAKLLNVVNPDLAFFGEKDYQQLQIVRQTVADLDFGVGIVACPTVRDARGMALSSRNANLTPEQRTAALALPEALEAACKVLAWGEVDAHEIEAAMREVFATAGDAIELDYVAVVDPVTLEPLDRVEAPARALVAARVGATRLIDNCELRPCDE